MRMKKSFVLLSMIALALSGCNLLPTTPARKSSAYSSEEQMSEISSEINIDSSSNNPVSSQKSSRPNSSSTPRSSAAVQPSSMVPSSKPVSSSTPKSSAPISSYQQPSSSQQSSSQPRVKRMPQLNSANYDNANYLNYDNSGNVVGINSMPEDGVLFINAPVAYHAFYSVSGFNTIFLGEGCTFIDEQAFYLCNDLKNVIIDSGTFPTLVYDTWGCTWDDEENFHVYVRDEIYDSLLLWATDDPYFNERIERATLKMSTLPQSLLSELGFSISVNDNSVSYSIRFYDPDSALICFDVGIMFGDGFFDSRDNMSDGLFEGLFADTEYTLRLRYEYDIEDGNGSLIKEVYQSFKTKALKEPSIYTDNYDKADYLNYDERGYVTGLKYAPSGGVLYINAPIADQAFNYNNNIRIVYLGPSCSAIGNQAFFYCENLKYIIVDREAFPTLTGNDTWGYTWSWDGFGVYVHDEIFESVSNLETNDSYWNKDHRSTQLYKISELPTDLKENIGFYLTIDDTQVSYRIHFFDPNYTISNFRVSLVSDGQAVKEYQNQSSQSFGDLLTGHEYKIYVKYTYDLRNGTEPLTVQIEKRFSTKYATVPTIYGSNKYNVDYLTYDNQGYVTGASYIPDDGVLFINAPIRENAFKDNHDFTTTVLGPGCTYIGREAFYSCGGLKNVIIDSHTFPELTENTWGCTWSWDGFGVYVYDDIYMEVSNLDTNDLNWNDSPRQCLVYKTSTLPDSLQKYIGVYLTTSSDSIDYRLNFYDPEDRITSVSVTLFPGNITYENIKGVFAGLLPNTQYSLEIHYQYDLNDGNSLISTAVTERVATKGYQAPEVILSRLSSDELIINSEGYVVGVTSVPEDGVLFINNPIADYGLDNLSGLHTLVLNQGCTSLGARAVNYCFDIDTVIINRDSFPTLVNDTFCATWSHNAFGVYVSDNVYTYASILETGDYYWDVEHRDTQLHRFSELDSKQASLLNETVTMTSTSISCGPTIYNPSHVDICLTFCLYLGDTIIATSSYGEAIRFSGLTPNTKYTLRVQLEYDLLDGNGTQSKYYSMNITTLES